jgi:2-polyprenyl-6-methoxyphenol hydroxylase-like FAD-dependent oxidoreductase
MSATSSAKTAEVLIVGAGPTGLVLAICLARRGVRVRIVDKLSGPEGTSRAIGVQARTLEYYRQFDFAGVLIARGHRAPATNLWVGGRHAARLDFQEMGGELTPYPFALVISQDEHERLLAEHLAGLGVAVERGVELTGLEEIRGGFNARLRRPDGTTEFCEAAYVAGCDGARSLVRGLLEIEFPGGTYDHRFYVADVTAGGPMMNGEMHVAVEAADFLAMFPLKSHGCARLIGMVPAGQTIPNGGEGWEQVDQRILAGLGLSIERLNWFSTYQVHHRIAGQFRRGRAFLAGDAAHIHTPVGGQGLNAGVGDAVNLAWKLAAVLRGRAGESLLDSYEPERMTFARRLVETTDRVFAGVTSPRAFDRWARLNLVPFLLPRVMKLSEARHFLFRAISQTAVSYRESNMSAGRTGQVHGGDRLPWVAVDCAGGGDNHAALSTMDWQVHVYGRAERELETVCAELRLPLLVFPWRPAMGRAGFICNGIYLVRPDGQVAMAESDARPQALAQYFGTRGLRSLETARNESVDCAAGLPVIQSAA